MRFLAGWRRRYRAMSFPFFRRWRVSEAFSKPVKTQFFLLT